jgi:hypothetical protein
LFAVRDPLRSDAIDGAEMAGLVRRDVGHQVAFGESAEGVTAAFPDADYA